VGARRVHVDGPAGRHRHAARTRIARRGPWISDPGVEIPSISFHSFACEQYLPICPTGAPEQGSHRRGRLDPRATVGSREDPGFDQRLHPADERLYPGSDRRGAFAVRPGQGPIQRRQQGRAIPGRTRSPSIKARTLCCRCAIAALASSAAALSGCFMEHFPFLHPPPASLRRVPTKWVDARRHRHEASEQCRADDLILCA